MDKRKLILFLGYFTLVAVVDALAIFFLWDLDKADQVVVLCGMVFSNFWFVFFLMNIPKAERKTSDLDS